MSERNPEDWRELLERLEADLAAQTSRARPWASDEGAWLEVSRRIERIVRLSLGKRSDVSPEDGEDILQNVLLKLQSGDVLKRMRSAASVNGYVWVVVRNAVNDYARRRRKERDWLTDFALEFTEDEPQDSAEAIGPSLTRLRGELRALTTDDRALLRMRFWKNLSISEIANELGISYSASAVRLFRLLRRLRERLAEP